jgi:hypothetical protein
MDGDRVTHTEHRNVTCPGCAGRRRISRTDGQTLSSFNVNMKTGLPKTRDEITDELVEWGAEWEPGGRSLYHQECWENHVKGATHLWKYG